MARVRIAPGNGEITVNGKPFDVYFPVEARRAHVTAPFAITETAGQFDVKVNVKGGGETGQAGATLLGIARALLKAQPDLGPLLRKHGLLTRDSRMVERKKPGLRKARRGVQFSKR